MLTDQLRCLVLGFSGWSVLSVWRIDRAPLTVRLAASRVLTAAMMKEPRTSTSSRTITISERRANRSADPFLPIPTRRYADTPIPRPVSPGLSPLTSHLSPSPTRRPADRWPVSPSRRPADPPIRLPVSSGSPIRRHAVSPIRFSLLADTPIRRIADPFLQVGHVASHGSMSVRPQPSNPLMSRVTTVALWDRATEAITRSTVAAGRPARLRAAKDIGIGDGGIHVERQHASFEILQEHGPCRCFEIEATAAHRHDPRRSAILTCPLRSPFFDRPLIPVPVVVLSVWSKIMIPRSCKLLALRSEIVTASRRLVLGFFIIDARHAVSPIRFPRSPTRRYAEPPTRFHSGPLCVRMAERYRLISLIPVCPQSLGSRSAIFDSSLDPR